MPSCSRCGHASPAEFRFCPSCGQPLVPEASEPREERKVVSVLFADLVGFTNHAERLDPEDVRALQDPYWRQVRAELERHGGTVEKFIGDAVVAVFGAPVAHEDDPERAVRAALAIRDWAREREEPQVRIAVTTGEALVRLGVEPLSGQGIVSGDVINTASRLQAEAPANGILVDEATWHATRTMIEYRTREALAVKGKSAPVPVFEAFEARSRFGVDLVQHVRTQLVGRERELALMSATLSRARAERAPQLLTLVGVPGIGKSRLVYELREAVARDPSEIVTWRQGRSLPYGDGGAYWAFAEMVKAQAGILDSDADVETEAKLVAAVQTLVDDEAEADWVARHLRPLVGVGPGGPPEERPAEAFAAWRRFFEALSESRPAVVVFEDVHWADDGLLDFVDGLVEWLSGVPLLVVATARPELLERRPGWGGGKANAVTLSLSPLSDDETAKLVQGLLEQPLPPEPTRALVAHAAGNALYAEQYVRMWEERGETEHLPPPDTVQGVIAARLDALSPVEKSLLQNAAIFGKVFWQGAVVAVDGLNAERVTAALHALERKEFVERARRSSVGGEREYAFRHVLVRDVAYNQIPRALRATRHDRAAGWIESLGRTEDHAEMIAHHYLSALDLARASGLDDEPLADRARLAATRAGDRAAAVNAFASAAAYYARALELTPVDEPGRPQLLFRHAHALARSGHPDRTAALEEARVALTAVGDVETAAETDALLAEASWFARQGRALGEHLDRALLAVAGRPASPAKARVLATVARFRMLAESDDAVETALEALALVRELGLPELQADVLITLGTAKNNSGELGEGDADIEHGIEIALQHNAFSAAQRGYNNLSLSIGQRGGPERRLELLREAERIAERVADPHQLRFARGEIIRTLRRIGDWDEAIRMADEFIAGCEAAGALHAQEAGVRVVRAEILLARGAVDVALAEFERALALAREAADPEALLPVLDDGIRLYAELGLDDDARRLAAEARTHEPRLVALHVVFPLAEHAAMLGVTESELARYLDHIPAQHWWRALLEHELRGDHEEIVRTFEGLGMRHEEAFVRLRAAERLIGDGRHREAQEHIQRALAFFEPVGATFYVERAHRLLERLHEQAARERAG